MFTSNPNKVAAAISFQIKRMNRVEWLIIRRENNIATIYSCGMSGIALEYCGNEKAWFFEATLDPDMI